MKLLFFLMLCVTIYAESYIISTIPLPKTYVQNLDPYPCNEECLEELLTHGQIFSFLAHAQGRLENPVLNDERLINASLFNLDSYIQSSRFQVAMLLPYKVIGRYASSTTNAVFSYLLANNRTFGLKTFQIENESPEAIRKALQQIREEHYYYIIAPLTAKGAQAVADADPEINVFFPTVNKNSINTESKSLFFGGIDYKAQIEKLSNEATSPLVIFYDKSSLGKQLRDYSRDSFLAIHEDPQELPDTYEEAVAVQRIDPNKKIISYAINKHTTNLERQLKENEKIQNGTFFLNTPIIKSGMVLSQLTLYDINVTNILSTQINYDPLILSITQAKDRNNMIIANSVTIRNNILIETNNLLNNDIVYDWINYATTVGVDFFFSMATRNEREYTLEMTDNQIIYPISLVQPSYSRFVPYVAYDDEAF